MGSEPATYPGYRFPASIISYGVCRIAGVSRAALIARNRLAGPTSLTYNTGMDIEFGDKKEADNLRVHKLSLALSLFVLETRVVEFEDDRHDYGERRMIVFGYLAGRLHCCVYTMRGTTYRIISLRKANDREQAKWAP